MNLSFISEIEKSSALLMPRALADDAEAQASITTPVTPNSASSVIDGSKDVAYSFGSIAMFAKSVQKHLCNWKTNYEGEATKQY